MTKFIAEISSNHNGDINRAKRLIETAAELKCWGVKFQLFRAKRLFHHTILDSGNKSFSPTKEQWETWELPLEWLPDLKAHAKLCGVQFGCTPFHIKAVDDLYPYVDFYKISSYDTINYNLIMQVAQQNKPTILSTGMATLPEINRAIKMLLVCPDLTILHCVSSYPTPIDQANLAAIGMLERETGLRVGLSDHSRDAGVVTRAIQYWGASVVEFHLDLDDRLGWEYSGQHCWTPGEIRSVIFGASLADMLDGSGYRSFVGEEKSDRGWRADPSDGWRPTLKVRGAYVGTE